MMMTIAVLCTLAGHNVRRYKVSVAVVLVSKAASALSALCVFLFGPKYLANFAITLVDGSIFWITLLFYIRASKAFFATETAFLRTAPVAPKSTGPTTVVVATGDDKFDLLDQVLAGAGFFEVLEKRFGETGKSKKDFAIAIKPNFMYMHSKKDVSTYTDPELVEALVDRIVERGFANISLVESQSTLGNYYLQCRWAVWSHCGSHAQAHEDPDRRRESAGRGRGRRQEDGPQSR